MTTTRSNTAVGLTLFAAITMMVLGGFDILQGLAAIIRQHYYVISPDYVYKVNVATWGWIHLVLGLLTLAAGIGLLSGFLWARILGVIFAAAIAITNFLWLPYYPVWAILIIALSVVVIWALAAHGKEIAE
ncbi:hypothetical protein SAMN05892883_4104 [Jatrophihabitans sp. GAS493]|uniref:DUF7144 family membrane protein n=1 Tax=Jatrophihabitans sp. GAS493 TaxID=1907575 RepID=UPI000BB67AC9|nr:hypothetical protein [Jatrophihabitans sp. GAS493]SOD74910.1 hypothetical protein SAMN05892883_4104 [Jatrophihabitans sp. GAS493]